MSSSDLLLSHWTLKSVLTRLLAQRLGVRGRSKGRAAACIFKNAEKPVAPSERIPEELHRYIHRSACDSRSFSNFSAVTSAMQHRPERISPARVAQSHRPLPLATHSCPDCSTGVQRSILRAQNRHKSNFQIWRDNLTAGPGAGWSTQSCLSPPFHPSSMLFFILWF